MKGRAADIVPAIYDTIIDPSTWPLVLDRISWMVDARGSLIFSMAGDELVSDHRSSGYDDGILAEYLDRFHAAELEDHKVFLRHSLKHDTPDIIPDTVLYSDLEEFQSRENIAFVMRFGILHRAAVLLNKDNTEIGRFAVQFGSDRSGITVAERAALNPLLPHIAKALDLGRPVRELRAHHSGLLAAIDHLSIGVCILDASGNLVEANDEFRRQVSETRVFRMTPKGRLALQDDGEQKRFLDLLADAENHGKFGARPRKEALTSPNGRHLCIEVAPLEHVGELGSRAFDGHVIYSTDTSQPTRYNAELFGRIHALTKAEIALVDLLAEGLTNAQIADTRNRSVATVNSQIKSILSKTGCATRTQLIRMLSSFGGTHLRD